MFKYLVYISVKPIVENTLVTYRAFLFKILVSAQFGPIKICTGLLCSDVRSCLQEHRLTYVAISHSLLTVFLVKGICTCLDALKKAQHFLLATLCGFFLKRTKARHGFNNFNR